jgi:acyl dehydratase
MTAGRRREGEATAMKLLGTGLHWDEIAVGERFRTYGRTITGPDIVNFIDCVGMVEALFTDAEFRRKESAIQGRVAPGALVFSMAEALVLQASAQGTGLAFLSAALEASGVPRRICLSEASSQGTQWRKS